MGKYGSIFDKHGKLYVDCTECERGIFGKDKDKCSAAKGKKHKGGCFLGILLSDIDKNELFRLE